MAAVPDLSWQLAWDGSDDDHTVKPPPALPHLAGGAVQLQVQAGVPVPYHSLPGTRSNSTSAHATLLGLYGAGTAGIYSNV